tara:strand:+ start:616 stop:1050 length:435 start_codon:yes stop_codon:yes gene_type:complete
MPVPAWVVPALILGGTAVSYYGSIQQQNQIRRAAKADRINRENKAKQLAAIAAEQGARKLSRARANIFASGTDPTGSSLLQLSNIMEEIEDAKFYASKALEFELSEIDTRGSLMMAKEAFSRRTNLLGGITGFVSSGNESGLFG